MKTLWIINTVCWRLLSVGSEIFPCGSPRASWTWRDERPPSFKRVTHPLKRRLINLHRWVHLGLSPTWGWRITNIVLSIPAAVALSHSDDSASCDCVGACLCTLDARVHVFYRCHPGDLGGNTIHAHWGTHTHTALRRTPTTERQHEIPQPVTMATGSLSGTGLQCALSLSLSLGHRAASSLNDVSPTHHR